jgi:hypothetical protein
MRGGASAEELNSSYRQIFTPPLGWQLHQKLESEEGIRNVTNGKKQGKRLEGLKKRAKTLGKPLPKLREGLQAATQLSVVYWRWIRSQLRIPTSWPVALGQLRHIYGLF